MKEFIRKHENLKRIIKGVIGIVKLPVLIPIGIILNIRKRIYTPKAEKSNSIAVLGRGTSLIEAGRLNFLKDFIIVNTTSEELKTEPVRSLLKKKRIIHMVNIGEGILPAWYLLKYNIYRYVISRLKPDGSEERMRSPRKVFATERFGFETDLLPEEMASYLEGLWSSGTVAVAYAAVVLKKKNVYIVGMDFYQTPYLIGPLDPREVNETTETKDKMVAYVNKLISKCPETNFYFITAFPFKSSLPNVKIYNYNTKLL